MSCKSVFAFSRHFALETEVYGRQRAFNNKIRRAGLFFGGASIDYPGKL